MKTSVRDDTLRYEAWVVNATDCKQTVTLRGSLRSWNGNELPYPALPDYSAEVEAGVTKRFVSEPIAW